MRLAVACLMVVGLCAAGAPPSVGAVSPPPRVTLPPQHLEFGLSNDDTTWMNASGVPWRYRFTYLAGGVNTTHNWLTWQDPTLPPGQFALDYMNNSTTAPANYIPVFTWYQLLQSTPSVGGSELDRDYSNLNNTSTMNSYYSSFTILMHKAAQYGKQVIVHIEPDFWGYMQQKAAGGDATTVPASVASSGNADVSGYANTVAGFAAALKHLRDTYAPNAQLAMHASMWASGIDVASDTDPSVNATGEADKTAAFLKSAGAATWDEIFNDVDDHNAAWWELASCSTPPCVNQYFTHWWDPSNVRFPNFARYESWVRELHARTLVPQVVWQVPMGNQFFLTMNNTCGHYQDNVAPYFIGHASELFATGLMAVMFGPGNSCQTSYYDASADGITNNNGVPTTDTLGGCSACNTHTSTYSDDDGGYLRIFVGKYYAGALPCSDVSVTGAAPPAPQVTGQTITFTALANACKNPEYEFWLLAPGASQYTLAQPYSASQTFSWTTANLGPGTYRIDVWARDTTSSGLYTNASGSWDAYNASTTYWLTPGCKTVGASAAPTSIAMAGTTVNVMAQSSCVDPGPSYEFWILYPGASLYTLAQPYSPSATLNWSTTGLALGTYRIDVWVRDATGDGAYGNASGRYDAYNAALTYTLTAGCPYVTASASTSGTTVTISASAPACPNPSYEFWILSPGATSYTLVQPYSTTSSFTWSSGGNGAGSYRINVWVKDGTGPGLNSNASGSYDAYNAGTTYQLT